MSFRITQCPACESTFSTSPRVLESAAGKVRCGACLTIFEAAENFLATDFDDEAENESVFVGDSDRGFFDPSSFFTRQSLRDALQESAPQTLPEPPAAADSDVPPRVAATTEAAAETMPEPHLDPEDPDTPDYLALDSAELAVTASGAAEQPVHVETEEDEFLALVADTQAPPPDLTRAAPVAELLAAGGYPALEEVIDALLADQQEHQAAPVTDAAIAGFLAAGGYPAVAEVILDLLAPDPAAKPAVEPDASASITAPFVPFKTDAVTPSSATEADSAAGTDRGGPLHTDGPGSLPLFPEEETPPAASSNDTALAPAETPPLAPEAFQLHVQFSVSPGAYKLPASPEADQQPVPGSSARLADSLEREFNAALNEADFQQALARDMDSAPSEQPDVELAPDGDPSIAVDHESRAEPAAELAEPDQSVAAIRARALQSDLQDDDGLEAIPQENLASLGAFSTPVEILTGRQRRLGKQLAWASLALLAATLLAGQYLWQESARYAQMASVRPAYQWVCELVGCELPVYSEIDAIQSSNLAVRSHPELDNALTVSIEFRNSASFAQPFPIMVLSFNSASNSIIALREFAPTDYLPPALRSRALMPPRSPVQINLELMDPGDDAVNYTLAFRRP